MGLYQRDGPHYFEGDVHILGEIIVARRREIDLALDEDQLVPSDGASHLLELTSTRIDPCYWARDGDGTFYLPESGLYACWYLVSFEAGAAGIITITPDSTDVLESIEGDQSSILLEVTLEGAADRTVEHSACVPFSRTGRPIGLVLQQSTGQDLRITYAEIAMAKL